MHLKCRDLKCLVRSTAILTAILKIGSYQRRVLAPEDRDVNCGPVLPSDLGLQRQRYVNGAVGHDDSTGAGTREQHSWRGLIYLVGETRQRGKQAPHIVQN